MKSTKLRMGYGRGFPANNQKASYFRSGGVLLTLMIKCSSLGFGLIVGAKKWQIRGVWLLCGSIEIKKCRLLGLAIVFAVQ